jgi:hypothetical protein
MCRGGSVVGRNDGSDRPNRVLHIMSLDIWQERLQSHFKRLSDDRPPQSAHPVFALEHGLDHTEVAQLSQEIRLEILHHSPLLSHWLPWVVYSSEIGYEYSGEEFWQTFANRTPGWTQREDREFIRSAFWKFHREFHGARPSGVWAAQFSIICWPIAHAILPQDLQLQLAEALYDIRHIFTEELLRSPDMLGQQIEAHSWNATSRFQEFAQEHLLVGQIATALLLNEEERESAQILRSTLDRIAADLDRNRRSREWLRSAVRRATSVRLHGLSRGVPEDDPYDRPAARGEPEGRKTVVELGIEPRLLLRRVDQHLWDVRLELPDLSRLLAKFPNLRSILAGERCTVAGTDGRPLARGYFLYGTQEVSLSSWPEPSQVLLKFENSSPDLDNLLTAECLLRPGPRWLFKMLNDGTAIEVRTKTVHPGNSYVVLEADAAGNSRFSGASLKVRCGGIKTRLLDIPDVISPNHYGQLAMLGFHASNGIRVSPVGLPATKWDHEGYSEWLTTDHPLVSISADFRMPGLALNLIAGTASSRIDLAADDITSPIFLELGQLEPGTHRLHVITTSPSNNVPLIGTLKLLVRDPKPWKGDVSASTSFVVLVSPANPSLDQMWDDTATFDLFGPVGRIADCEVHFLQNTKDQSFYRAQLPVDLPCSSGTWQQLFGQLKKDIQVQNAYNACDACEFHFRCDELGFFRFKCERQGTPLRWVVREENSGYFLQLLQLDEASAINVAHCEFQNPERRSPVVADYSNGFRVPPPGGLYVALAGRQSFSVVVPPSSIQTFADFELKPNRQLHQRTERDVISLLDILELWSNARVTGNPLSVDYKEQIVSSLQTHLIELLYGDFWARLERSLSKSTNFLVDLRNDISTDSKLQGIGRDLFAKQAEIRQFNLREVCEFLEQTASKYLDLPPFITTETSRYRWIVEFAVRLGIEAHRIKEWAGDHLPEALRYVLEHSIILRMSRFAALVRSTTISGSTISKMADNP